MKKVFFLIITFLLISTPFVQIVQSKESTSSPSNFIQNYLSEEGYVEIPEQSETFERNDIIGTITPIEPTTRIMSIQEKEQIYVVNLKDSKSNAEINFLLKTENIDDKAIITMFNEEGGVKIDFTNKVILETWSTHNTCSYWTCVGNYIIHMLTQLDFYLECGLFCVPNPLTPDCITCVLIFASQGIFDCLDDYCAWYSCKQDCSDNNWYGSYQYYCVNDKELWEHRYYYAYKCPDGVDYGEEGDCVSDSSNSGWINDTYVMTCYYECYNGECVDETITTTTTLSTTTSLSVEERLKALEERVTILESMDSIIIGLINSIINAICSVHPYEGFEFCPTTTTTPTTTIPTTTTAITTTSTTTTIGCPCDFIEEDYRVCCPSGCQTGYYCRADIYRFGRYQRSEDLNPGQCKSVNPSQYSIKLYGICE